MSNEGSFSDLRWNDHTYSVERGCDAVTVWDAEERLFTVPGSAWTDDQLKSVLVVYRTGCNVGETSGRIALQCELRRLLGAVGEYELASAVQQ